MNLNATGSCLPFNEERQLLALPPLRNVQGFPQRFQEEGCKPFLFYPQIIQS